jgi:hypothetical protein
VQFDAQSFVIFIVACATTHGLAILTLWVPAYGIEGLAKALTAVASIATASGTVDHRSSAMTSGVLPAETWLALTGAEYAAWVKRNQSQIRDPAIGAIAPPPNQPGQGGRNR